ncbi:C4-dicarboxylate ABC transporter [Deltaproteobacteria bacterium]|nr:C4-dicarboxylate ABC transporter [Deltaproteobacteria bacterium]
MEEKKSRALLRKSYTGPALRLVVGVAVAWMLFQVLVAAQFVFMAPHKIRIVHLGFAMLTVFLITPFSRNADTTRLSVVDVLLSLAAIAVFAAALVRYDALILMGGRYQPIDIYIGIAAIVLLYEAARRMISPGLVILSLITLAYAFWGDQLTGVLGHTGFSHTRIVRHLFIGGEGVFGFALGVSAEIIVIFVLFGAILQEVGIADYFYDLANALAGRQRGGPAKVAVISSSLMGMVSGETSANVATTGAFTIPLMKRVGYTPNFAGAVECAASAGGQILPPVMGATAFMLADTLGIPYIQLAIAAVLPALLYYVSVFSIVHFRAVRLDMKPSDDVARNWRDLLRRSYLMLPLFGLVALLVCNYTPTFAAFWGGIGLALVVSFFKKETRISVKKLLNIAHTAARTAMIMGVATAVVGVIVGTFSLTGISMTVARMVFEFTGGVKILTLFLTMVVAMILGMGLPTSAAYVLASISAAPALTMVGIPILPAHLFVFYFGCMSTITPPVATGAYAAAGLSGGNPNMIGFLSMRLAMSGFIVPFVFIYQPDLLLGSEVDIAVTAFTFLVTVLGLIYMSAAFEGALWVPVGPAKRFVYAVIAVPLLWPDTFVSLVALAAAAGVFAVDYARLRLTKRAAAEAAPV